MNSFTDRRAKEMWDCSLIERLLGSRGKGPLQGYSKRKEEVGFSLERGGTKQVPDVLEAERAVFLRIL